MSILLILVCTWLQAASASNLVQLETLHRPETCTDTVREGDVVFFGYITYLVNGSVFDSSAQLPAGAVSHSVGDPHDESPVPMDVALTGMCRGESRAVTLPAGKGHQYVSPSGRAAPFDEQVRIVIDLMEILRMDQLFGVIDTDGDGKIGRDELRAYMKNQFDKSHGSAAGSAIKWVVHHSTTAETEDETVEDIYRHQDVDGDGYLSAAEFQRFSPHQEL